MTARSQFLFWSATFLAFLGFVWVFKGVLLPFVLGIAVAYLLNPVVNWLGEKGLRRSWASLLILGGFMVVLLAVLAMAMPLVIRQILELMENIPAYADAVWTALEPRLRGALGSFGENGETDIKALLSENISSAMDVGRSVFGGLVAGGQAVVSLGSTLIFMPIVAYFMMEEWPRMIAWARGLLPRRSEETIVGLLQEIDGKIAGFVRGQIMVAACLGVIYALALSVAGLQYGFLIGLGAGALSIIPMVGSVLGLIVSVGVAWFQSGDWIYVLIIAAIFWAGQLFEGNILTPKLVGDSIGLHPLWVFFALLAGGNLFGILGMLLAIPVTASIGVLVSFAIRQYKESEYYSGDDRADDADGTART